MPMLETSQGALFMAQRGAGNPVVVSIHGAGGTHQHWGRQLAGLQDVARMILLDLPGHGRSEPPGRDSIAEYSEVLLAALDTLQLDQVVLAGHSMGGAIALWLALTTPTRVSGLILTGTGARLRVAPAILDALQQAYDVGVKMIVDGVYDENAAPDLKMAGELGFMEVAPDVFQSDLAACDAFDVRPRMREITCPTLVLCGSSDQMTPPKFSTFLGESIAGAHLEMIPHAGHMVMLEQPEVVNNAIRRWLISQYKSD